MFVCFPESAKLAIADSQRDQASNKSQQYTDSMSAAEISSHYFTDYNTVKTTSAAEKSGLISIQVTQNTSSAFTVSTTA